MENLIASQKIIYKTKKKYHQEHTNSQVIYNCKWWLGDILISLSVFGGIRSKTEGNYAASLYFDWLNEEKIAKPYLKEFTTRTSELSEKTANVSKIDLKYATLPFHKNHYELEDPYLALKNSDVRTAQLILYSELLYKMPKEISDELSENEIVLFKSQKTGLWCVGNKWDVTPITKESKLRYIDIKPVRGLGGTEIQINSLNIHDEKDSECLMRFSKAIEKLTSLQFVKSIGYDD